MKLVWNKSGPYVDIGDRVCSYPYACGSCKELADSLCPIKMTDPDSAAVATDWLLERGFLEEEP